MGKVLLAVLLLHGCAGNICIQEGYFEGDKIRNLDTGKVMVVKKRYGTSPQCLVPSHPILADVE